MNAHPSPMHALSTAQGRALWCALALLAALGCERAPKRAPDPPGLHLVADGAALSRGLARAALLSGTPLGDAAARARQALEGCASVVGSAPTGEATELLAALRCGEAEGALAAAHASAGKELTLASGDGGPWTLFHAAIDERGGLFGELSFPEEVRGMGSLLAPAEAPAGRPVFTSDGALVKGRFRVRGGIDLEKLKTEQKTTEKMKLPDFSGLLSGALLDGTWELAVYAPEEGTTTPRITLALGVRSARAAKAGMDALLADLEETWQLSRSAFKAGGAEGACLLDLTVLPDLAPCWLLKDGHIALGWNQRSLLRAVTKDGDEPGSAESRLVVGFAAMSAFDEQMTKVAFEGAPPPVVRYPWESLSLEAAGEGRLKLALPARSDAP